MESKLLGFKGISFPFRIDSSGRVATSTTSPNDFTHIKESIEQILKTRKYERIMENDFGNEIDISLFEVADDPTNLAILKHNITECIETWDNRVKVLDVKFEIEDTLINAYITIFVKKYLVTDVVTVTFERKVGEY
ncbi:MAG: GPW/gp25 family protein [Thermosipho sp. (in: Bacteria)]|nr:GPW/gp25 family protein [Thermosipho sp. (in: thermotogales)]